MWPVSIKRKCEKFGTLNIVVIFFLFISFYSKNLSIEGFSIENSFFKFFYFSIFFAATNLAVNKYPI
jgi:hypothetical protein